MKTIRILFIHPNFPGQFKYVLNELCRVKNVELAYITRNQNAQMEGVNIKTYQQPSVSSDGVNRYLRIPNVNLSEAQEVTRQAVRLKSEGFIPNVIVGHIGWGGTSFMKDVFEDAKVIGYCEWYFRKENSWQAFAKEDISIDQKANIRIMNTPSLWALQSMDRGVTPMYWQRSVFPKHYQDKMEVIPEGVDTEICKPGPRSHLNVPGANITKDKMIVTYVSRAMEPARGFFSFMAAAEILSSKYQDLQFVIVGRARPAYSPSTGDGPSYKEQALAKHNLDLSRFHFTGKLQYEDYLSVLRNSSVHIHLSSPLFLSWSLLESMACGCAIVGSENAPVNEVIENGVNGLLVPFFDEKKVASKVDELLQNKEYRASLGNAARATIQNDYNASKCKDRWLDLILRQHNDNFIDDYR